MTKMRSTKAIFAAIFVFVLILFSILFCPTDIANAILPVDYVTDVTGNALDWWTGDDYLGISTLKWTVASWKADAAYDFEYLKKHPIIVAVIDSGIDLTHELFTGKYGENGVYSEGEVDENGIGKYDVILRDTLGNPIVKNTASGYNSNNVADDASDKHGTHVCGIIATLIHSLDLEQYIKILPIKASSGKNFTGSSVKNAIEFAISKGASAVNMSLSSEQESFADIKYSSMHEKTVLVAAAGNDWRNVKRYPAALSNVIGVMNYRQKRSGETELKLSDSSNFGTYYDLCAPGDAIYSAKAGNDTSHNSYDFDKYKRLSGTSMASPVVAFGAALVTMKYAAIAGDSSKHKTPQEIAELVRNAFTDTLKKGGDDHKIFDINALVGVTSAEASIVLDESFAFQRLGSIKPVELKLNVLPNTYRGKGNVRWFIGDELIGSGFNIEYTPKSKVGLTKIDAVWDYHDESGEDFTLTSSVNITVDYAKVTGEYVSSMKISAFDEGGKNVVNNELDIGKPYHVQIDGLQNLSADEASSVKWYVNDVMLHVGPSFDFIPQGNGEYKIKFKIDNFSSEEMVLMVIQPSEETHRRTVLSVISIAVSAALAIVVLTVIITVLAKHLSKRKNRLP